VPLRGVSGSVSAVSQPAADAFAPGEPPLFHIDCGFPVDKLWKCVVNLMMLNDFALFALSLRIMKTGIISIYIEIIHKSDAFP